MKKLFKKHIALIIILVILIVFPISLSNQAKLSMRIIVTGLAIDKNGDKYEVTAQIVKASPGTESAGTSATIDFISSEGDTIDMALSLLSYKSGKVSAFSHTNFVILGSDVLDEDVTKCLDLFVRNKQIRSSALLTFAKEKAKDEIEKTKQLGIAVGVGMQKVFLYKEEEGDAIMTTILDFLTESKSFSKTAMASELAFESNEEQSSDTSSSESSGQSESSQSSSGESDQSEGSSSSGSSGSSDGGSNSSSSSENVYFKPKAPILCFVDGKLACKFEDIEEVTGVLITDRHTQTIQIGLDEFSHENLEDTKVSIRVDSMHTSFFVRFEEEIPCLDVKVNITNSEIVEILGNENILGINNEVYEDIKNSLKKKISTCISKAFEKAKESNADMFGAYELAYKFKYGDLKKYYDDETEFIKNLKLNVEVDVRKLEN